MTDTAQLIVIYDDGCAFCRATARWVARHDRRARLQWQPIGDLVLVRGLQLARPALAAEMHVVDGAGRVERGFRAGRRIAREVPLLLPVWPFLWLPGVAPIGDLVYRWVAAHRQAISRRLGFDACGAACGRSSRPGEMR